MFHGRRVAEYERVVVCLATRPYAVQKIFRSLGRKSAVVAVDTDLTQPDAALLRRHAVVDRIAVVREDVQVGAKTVAANTRAFIIGKVGLVHLGVQDKTIGAGLGEFHRPAAEVAFEIGKVQRTEGLGGQLAGRVPIAVVRVRVGRAVAHFYPHRQANRMRCLDVCRYDVREIRHVRPVLVVGTHAKNHRVESTVCKNSGLRFVGVAVGFVQVGRHPRGTNLIPLNPGQIRVQFRQRFRLKGDGTRIDTAFVRCACAGRQQQRTGQQQRQGARD